MNFRCNLKMLLAISGLLGSVSIFAAPITTEKKIASSQSTALQGLYFQHQDWELACDNTGTCRAAGYQSDDNFEQPISMLLTRQAGAKTAVQGQLQYLPEFAIVLVQQVQRLLYKDNCKFRKILLKRLYF